MKVRLLFADRDPDTKTRLPARVDDLIRDLGIDSLLAAMAPDDPQAREQLTLTLLRPLTEADAITYRQDVLDDFLALPELASALYSLSVHAVDSPKRSRTWVFGKDPSSILHRSRGILTELLPDLHELRRLADTYAGRCRSAGLTAMFATIQAELPDDYFPMIDDHLQRLHFPTGDDEGADRHAVFLRPERRDDAARTFRILPGKPQPTSYGPDLYRRVFARSADPDQKGA